MLAFSGERFCPSQRRLDRDFLFALIRVIGGQAFSLTTSATVIVRILSPV